MGATPGLFSGYRRGIKPHCKKSDGTLSSTRLPTASVMNRFTVCLVVCSLAASITAEPPVGGGYSYNRPSGGYSGGGGGGGGFGGGLGGGFGGGYTAVSSGYQTSEGQNVDPQLLEQVRQILLKEEQSSGGGHGGGGGGGGYPSSQYGAPSPQYGVPSYQTRVVGIDLDGVRQAIQVAQFHQQTEGQVGGGGYPSGPSSSYGAPSRPSGSYGAPF